MKALNEITGGGKKVVKSHPQNKTADESSISRFAAPSPKPGSAGCLGCHSFQICAISEHVLVTVQKCSSWVTALPADGGTVRDQAQKLLQVNLQTLSFLWQRPQPVAAALKWSAFEEWVSGRETERKAIREPVRAVTKLCNPWKQWQGMTAQTSATNANKKQWPWCACSSSTSNGNLHTNFFIYVLYIYIYIYGNGVFP